MKGNCRQIAAVRCPLPIADEDLGHRYRSAQIQFVSPQPRSNPGKPQSEHRSGSTWASWRLIFCCCSPRLRSCPRCIYRPGLGGEDHARIQEQSPLRLPPSLSRAGAGAAQALKVGSQAREELCTDGALHGRHIRPGEQGRHHRRAVMKLWVTTKEMAEHLSMSEKTLYRMKSAGVLKGGRHWTRINPAAPKSPMVWHIQRCEIALGRV